MSAQEAVNKVTTANEEDLAISLQTESDWSSPEVYYASHGVRSMKSQREPMAEMLAVARPSVERLEDIFLPEPISSPSQPQLPLKGPTAVVAQSPLLVASHMPDDHLLQEPMRDADPSGHTPELAEDLDLGDVLGLDTSEPTDEQAPMMVDLPAATPQPREPLPVETRDLANDQAHQLPVPKHTPPDSEAVPSTDPPADLVQTQPEASPRPYHVPSLGTEFPSYHSQPAIDAQALIQQRAAERAAQRRQRIEARKWLGYSPGRPPASPTPFMSGTPDRPVVIAVPYPVREPIR